MTGAGQRVAIITGGSRGIGVGLVAAYRRRDWAVVANSRRIKPSEDGAVLTISGDISEPATTDRIKRGQATAFLMSSLILASVAASSEVMFHTTGCI
jgi:NAD(P)-dependent dehydrogenase (short-subunit alcohol dehydrogenase family)